MCIKIPSFAFFVRSVMFEIGGLNKDSIGRLKITNLLSWENIGAVQILNFSPKPIGNESTRNFSVQIDYLVIQK